MNSSKLIENIATACFMLIVMGFGLNALSQMHLFGITDVYKIPQELIYILLALVGVGGASRTIGKLAEKVKGQKQISNSKSSPKLCEHSYLDECPLTVIDKYKEQDQE